MFSIYNLSTSTPLYTSTSHVVSICSAIAFGTRLPRCVAYIEGPMSSVMPVEIFLFLLSLVPVLERAGKWFLLGTLSVYFASMMSTRFSKDCNVVCAFLGEETAVTDEFVQSMRAAIINADTWPSKSWEDVYHDLGAGFPVDCSGLGVYMRILRSKMRRQSRNRRHTLQRRTPKQPLPRHLVARCALKPPLLPPQALWPLLAGV